MEFGNRNLCVLFTWGDTVVYLTETIFATWVIMAVLIAFTILVRIRMKSFRSIPTGFQNVIETAVEMMMHFVHDTVGAELAHWDGYFFGLFLFIIASNYSGMFCLRPPTSDIATTGALALTVFAMIHGLGIARRKGKYFKSYIEPVAIFLPINLIGELAKPLSLAFRLFGNILSGVIIAGLLYNMLPLFLRFLLPDIAHAYFDVVVGAIQAYVFTTLSMTFIKQMSSEEV